MIETLEAKILEELQNLKYEDDKPCFTTVEDTFTLTPSGYPYAVFEIDGITGERLDSCRNERKFTFLLQIYRDFASLSGTDQEKRRIARRQVAKIVDRIILLFDTNEFLDGVVDTSDVINVNFATYSKTDGKDGAGYIAEMEIPLTKLIFIK